MAMIDETGNVYNRLTVLRPTGKDHYGVKWLCKCECGNEATVRGSHLRNGNVKSCGCLAKEVGKRSRTHGNATHTEGPTKEYYAWTGIIQRCENPKQPGYENYGGRGITVCERWRNSFEAFLDDMGKAPTSKHSVGRLDNDGPYCPDNCEWQTSTQQARNRRGNHLVEYDGRRQTVTEWAIEKNIPPATLYKRFENGWSVIEALTIPLHQCR